MLINNIRTWTDDAVESRALADEHATPPSFDGPVLDDRALFRRFEAMHRSSQRTGDLLERESRTLMFLRDLFVRHAHAGQGRGEMPQTRTVSLVRQTHGRCCESISIDDLAIETGVSGTQAIRWFTASIGLAPHAYPREPSTEARHVSRGYVRMVQDSVFDEGQSSDPLPEGPRVELPAVHMVEYGHVLPAPGNESQWLANLPHADRALMESIGA